MACAPTATPGIDVLEIIRTLAPVATAVIALVALRNWQKQDKAKREAEFLDALLDATHAFITQIRGAAGHLAIVKIGIESHAPTWEQGREEDKAYKGAVDYIKNYGPRDGKRLSDALQAAAPPMIHLRSLAAKGQIFRFVGYPDCHNAVTMLTWQFDRIQALATVLGSSINLNWDNPEVRKTIEAVTALNVPDVTANIDQTNIAIIKFVRETYARIYD